MKTVKEEDVEEATPINAEHHRAVVEVEREAGGALAGAVSGAAIGSIAGPPGAIAGALIGAAAGALAGKALDNDARNKEVETEALDAEIGIGGDDLGAPNLKHPPAKIGAYSGGSAGVSDGAEDDVAEGPMQSPKS